MVISMKTHHINAQCCCIKHQLNPRTWQVRHTHLNTVQLHVIHESDEAKRTSSFGQNSVGIMIQYAKRYRKDESMFKI